MLTGSISLLGLLFWVPCAVDICNHQYRDIQINQQGWNHENEGNRIETTTEIAVSTRLQLTGYHQHQRYFLVLRYLNAAIVNTKLLPTKQESLKHKKDPFNTAITSIIHLYTISPTTTRINAHNGIRSKNTEKEKNKRGKRITDLLEPEK
jgi:hypothetical protein